MSLSPKSWFGALAAERRAMAARLSVFRQSQGIPDVYEHMGSRFASKCLLTLADPLAFSGFENDLTGAQIRDLGYKIANALWTTGSLKPNTRVIVSKENHLDWFFYMHSVIRAGGVPVAVNNRVSWQFLASVQKRTDAQVLITDAATLLRNPDDVHLRRLLTSGIRVLVVSPEFDEVAERWPGIQRLEHLWPLIEAASATPPPPRTLSDDSPVAMFHTSGTTGEPKLCVYDGRNTRQTWKMAASFPPVGGMARLMQGAPSSHAIFFIIQTGTFLSGIWSYGPPKFDPHKWLSAIEQHGIHAYLGFPYTYMRMAAEDLSRYNLDSMMLWVSGADLAHAAHVNPFVQLGKHRVGPIAARGSMFTAVYGTTEMGGGGVFAFTLPRRGAVPNLLGKPMPGVTGTWGVKIVDDHWRPLPAGRVGRIMIDPTTIPNGYWNDHDRWTESRIDGWWWAGDLGYLDENDRLFLMDRHTDPVRTAHGTLYSLPAEEVVLTHPRVMEASVVQRTTDAAQGTGEAVAFVVPKGHLRPDDATGSWTELAAEILAYANERLSPKLAEVKIVSLEELPLGVTGKVLKRRLRERLNEARPVEVAQVS